MKIVNRTRESFTKDIEITTKHNITGQIENKCILVIQRMETIIIHFLYCYCNTFLPFVKISRR